MNHPLLYVGCLALLMAFMAAGTLATGRLLRRWTPDRNLLLTLPDNLLRLALIAACLLLGVTLGPGPEALGWVPRALPSELAVGAGIGLAMAGVYTLLGRRSLGYAWGERPELRLVRSVLPASPAEWAGVAAALLPAAALEELLFRSLSLAGLAPFIRPVWLMWPLAIFFGLLHWPQGAPGIAGAATAAILFSALFLLTGSIWTALAAHYVMNLSELVFAARLGLQPLRDRSA